MKADSTIRIGDRYVLDPKPNRDSRFYPDSQPGEVIAEPQDGWVTLRFTVDRIVLASDLREWCPVCRNFLGHWECAELGRFCNRCQCDAEHTWASCLVCEAGRENARRGEENT